MLRSFPRSFRAIVGLLALSSAAVASGGPASAAASAPAAVCTGVSNCHLVARVDVSGDGRPDEIGWRQLSSASVQIRVLTSSDTLMTRVVDVHLWYGGGAWGGAARVDHAPGAEILVGSEQGAHTPMYTMLTLRDGALVVEPSPSPLGARWQVDAAYGDYMGWSRHTLADGRIAMTQQIAFRAKDGTSFNGHDETYVWGSSGWTRLSRSTTHYANQRAVAAIGGFHVPGLARFPGLG